MNYSLHTRTHFNTNSLLTLTHFHFCRHILVANLLMTFTQLMFIRFSIQFPQEYNLQEVKDRQFLISMHKKAMKANFQIAEYNRLKAEAAQIESYLHRLRDPLRPGSTVAATAFPATVVPQTEKDRLFQTALTSPTVAAMDAAESSKPTIRERLTNMFKSLTKKSKK